MKVNLSLVLDEDCKIRLDLIRNKELKEVDKYTTTKIDNKEIREDFKVEIENFLNLNKNYTNTFKRESNKKGSIVITLEDENNKLRRLRVLYNKNINKLDTDLLINRIISTLKNIKDINKTKELINKYRHLIFGSNNEYNLINEANYKYHNILNMTNEELKQKKINNINNNLILLIKNRFLSLNKGSLYQQELCYYYLRLVDAFIEKNFKVYTTKEIINTKAGKIKINVNETKDNKILNKEYNEFNGQKMIVEDDGQFTIFSDESEYQEINTRLGDVDYINNYYDGEDEITNHGKY